MTPNKKKRRHDGWVYPVPTISKKDLEEQNLVIEPYYDEWNSSRDSFRSPFDRSQLRSENTFYGKLGEDIKSENQKLYKLKSRRNKMRQKKLLKGTVA